MAYSGFPHTTDLQGQHGSDCDSIVAAAHAATGSFMVGHICRFNPRYAAAK